MGYCNWGKFSWLDLAWLMVYGKIRVGLYIVAGYDLYIVVGVEDLRNSERMNSNNLKIINDPFLGAKKNLK